MPIYRLGAHTPEIAGTAFVAPEAVVVGQVSLGERSSVWFGAVIRGDNEPIVIGAACNMQEGAVLHADPGFPLRLGERVTVGHQAMLHGAIVTERKVFADRSLILGAPAKEVRELSDADVANLERSAADYAQRAAAYPAALERVA